jgi:peptide/nickel transport system substrate-binding protein
VIEWERNPNYYNPKLPYLDGVKQFILVERSTQVAAVKSGQIILWNVGPPMRKGEADEVQQARKDQGEVYSWPDGSITVAYMHHHKAPFDNPEIRRAVHLAIDRQRFWIHKSFPSMPCRWKKCSRASDATSPRSKMSRKPNA